MDNVLTSIVKPGPDGQLVYDFSDLDKRVDFIAAVGAEPILAASYMPEPFDAVPSADRQSAPQDYALWEDLCYRTTRRCLERGKRVPHWEVWSEVNTAVSNPAPTTRAPRPSPGSSSRLRARRPPIRTWSGDSKPTASSTGQPPAASSAPTPQPGSADPRWPAAVR